ncbi:MAG: hypothetical protein A2751_05050 [Candidatus Doudnabacteria bacterium RIFCSPHIGHO2_01_FULL_46_14]|uniref:Uncharacterized protein n=1 Tax=Candidatus Doudnabacteria bacterium RIFCSPHIGHO2_01_FULL_46_14 TaxID=1817824 RepID=A0A1F5NNQ8_9BACT|nr:MAG: hypothetical protein A2751_05050 [Candidatus Doudnabacteria bacterium RIFCSPHIGHO2_01_FULL_46_14]HLB58710.1 hypothetical protein [Bdellovibrionota bacterium]
MDNQDLARERELIAVREQIKAEIREAEESGEFGIRFNNFPTRLAESIYYIENPGSYPLKDKWDTLTGKNYPDLPKWNSDKYKEGTMKSYSKDLAGALQNSGLKDELLQFRETFPDLEQRREMSKEKVAEWMQKSDDMKRKLLPVYTKLRELGYSQYDLVG